MDSVDRKVKKSASSMYNTLPSSESLRHHDWCHGIHGAARWRRGIKKGTSTARRVLEKKELRKFALYNFDKTAEVIYD